jgi:RimJ/RimL family protein N-acetyltransferase
VGVLREVVEADLSVFYEYERDREAAAMAAFPPRERDAFMARWAKTLADDSALTWTVVSDGAVAGNIGCWEDDGRRLVGYWIGREFWGRGLATQALAELLDVVDARPLQAYVVMSNVASSTRATTGSWSSSWSCGDEDRPELRAQGERA